MNISQISIPINVKKADPKSKGEGQLGKVISKNGKEIQVLIKDKVYKIEPGNVNKIKTGDMIQVFFGKELPQEVSGEVLKKIGAKLLDVFSLSLPFKASKELEGLINQLPQHEKMHFARVSNQISSLAESILTEDFNMEIKETVEGGKNAFDLYDPRLPFNRRLIEISLKAKAMGESWDQIPDKIKKEIIKEFVLYDMKKVLQPATEKVGDESLQSQSEPEKINTEETKEIPANVKLLEKEAEKPESEVSSNTKKMPVLTKNTLKTNTNGNLITNNKIPLKVPMETKPASDIKTAKMPTVPEKDVPVESIEIKKTTVPNEVEKISVELPISKSVQSEIRIQNNVYRPSVDTSRDELIKQTVNELKDLLKELLSKPLNMEKNHEQLSQTNHKFETTMIKDSQFLPTSVLSNQAKTSEFLSNSVEEVFHKAQIPLEDKNILSILDKLIKSGTEKNINFDSVMIDSEKFNKLISNGMTFETVKSDPMMNFEVKNLIRQLGKLGIAPKESATIANDIVNLAVRSFKDPQISQNILPNSLKNYLKMRLPQTIIENEIPQANEKTLIGKLQSFSQKAYVIVKDFVHKLIARPDPSNSQPVSAESAREPLIKTETATETKTDVSQKTTAQDSVVQKEVIVKSNEDVQLNKRFKSMVSDMSSNQRKEITSSLEQSQMLNDKGKQIVNSKINLVNTEIENKQPLKENDIPREILMDDKTEISEKKSLELGLPEKNELTSERLLKLLNITSDKNEFNHVYSALLNFNNQDFAVDFQKQSVNKSGYEKAEMYRVYIETDTQRFGNIFVDTIVTGENIDIYIYAGQEHAREFTNHSSVLSKRIKETDYNLRSLLIREKVNQNDILKHKVKLYTDSKKDGGFFKLV